MRTSLSGPVAALSAANALGLLLGTVLPAAHHLRPLAVPLLFVQTLIAVGALSEERCPVARRWAGDMFVRHHLAVSLPLMALGAAMGLDTALGAGTFVLGAVPTAVTLPSNVAAFGGHVRPIVQYTFLAYGVGVVLTPLVVLVGLGTVGRGRDGHHPRVRPDPARDHRNPQPALAAEGAEAMELCGRVHQHPRGHAGNGLRPP